MNCIIIDDEPLARKGLEKYVSEIPDLKWTGSFGNATEALTFLAEHSVDLLLLDIQMHGMNGIELLQKLEVRPLTIIISANPGYAVEAFNLEVIDYLVKPVLPERFAKAIEKAGEYYEFRKQKRDFTFLKVNGVFKKFFFDEILYLEAMSNYVVIHCETHKSVVYHSFKSIMEILPEDVFLRIHKSYMVNKGQVSSYTRSQVAIKHVKLPVGRLYGQSLPWA